MYTVAPGRAYPVRRGGTQGSDTPDPRSDSESEVRARRSESEVRIGSPKSEFRVGHQNPNRTPRGGAGWLARPGAKEACQRPRARRAPPAALSRFFRWEGHASQPAPPHVSSPRHRHRSHRDPRSRRRSDPTPRSRPRGTTSNRPQLSCPQRGRGQLQPSRPPMTGHHGRRRLVPTPSARVGQGAARQAVVDADADVTGGAGSRRASASGNREVAAKGLPLRASSIGSLGRRATASPSAWAPSSMPRTWLRSRSPRTDGTYM